MILFRYPVFYCVLGLVFAGTFDEIRSEWWGLILLSVLMCLYAFFSARDDGQGKREIGDNCYFIGFVYTLLVITWSLILDSESLLSTKGKGLEPLLKTVGIALGTSVVGMMLRFYFSHGVKTPQDNFQMQVQKAAVAAQEMAGAAKTMTGAAKTIDQKVNRIVGAMSRYAERIEEETQKIKDQVESAFTNLLNNMAEQIQDTLQKNLFAEVKDELSKAVDEYRSAIQIASQHLSDSMAKLNNATEAATLNATATKNAIQSLAAVINDEKWEEVDNAVSALSKRLNELSRNLQALSQRQASTVQTAEADVARLKEMRASFDSLKNELSKDIEEVGAIKENYRREYQEAARIALAETHKLYASLIAGAEIALAGLDKKGGENPETIAKLVESGKEKE